MIHATISNSVNTLFRYNTKHIVNFVRQFTPYQHAVVSYAQEGEDLLLLRAIGDKGLGFYVDVGAHHPRRFSNTYLFYRRGWRGINIDAMPDSMKAFNKERPRDINIEAAISDSNSEITYLMLNEPALNSFDAQLSCSRAQGGAYRIIAEKKVLTRTLAQLLTEYLPQNQIIDFLSVDVEGMDLNVLRSNDWNRFRPRLVLVECLSTESLQTSLQAEVSQFLMEKKYLPFAKTFNTLLFNGGTE